MSSKSESKIILRVNSDAQPDFFLSSKTKCVIGYVFKKYLNHGSMEAEEANVLWRAKAKQNKTTKHMET